MSTSVSLSRTGAFPLSLNTFLRWGYRLPVRCHEAGSSLFNHHHTVLGYLCSFPGLFVLFFFWYTSWPASFNFCSHPEFFPHDKFPEVSLPSGGHMCFQTLDSHSPKQPPERLPRFAYQLCLSPHFPSEFHHCWDSPFNIIYFICNLRSSTFL